MPKDTAGYALPDGFPPELAYRALGCYSILRTLSVGLRLSPFTTLSFLRGLAIELRTPLIDEIHTTLLRFLRQDIKGKGRIVAGKRSYPSLDWGFLDISNWPCFYVDAVEKRQQRHGELIVLEDDIVGPMTISTAADAGDESGIKGLDPWEVPPEVAAVALRLVTIEYHRLPVVDRLVILEDLCQRITCLPRFTRILDARTTVPDWLVMLQGLEENEEDTNIALCFLDHDNPYGQLTCCDMCPLSWHTKCAGENKRTIPGTWCCPECRLREPGHHRARVSPHYCKVTLAAIHDGEEEEGEEDADKYQYWALYVLGGYIFREIITDEPELPDLLSPQEAYDVLRALGKERADSWPFRQVRRPPGAFSPNAQPPKATVLRMSINRDEIVKFNETPQSRKGANKKGGGSTKKVIEKKTESRNSSKGRASAEPEELIEEKEVKPTREDRKKKVQKVESPAEKAVVKEEEDSSRRRGTRERRKTDRFTVANDGGGKAEEQSAEVTSPELKRRKGKKSSASPLVEDPEPMEEEQLLESEEILEGEPEGDGELLPDPDAYLSPQADDQKAIIPVVRDRRAQNMINLRIRFEEEASNFNPCLYQNLYPSVAKGDIDRRADRKLAESLGEIYTATTRRSYSVNEGVVLDIDTTNMEALAAANEGNHLELAREILINLETTLTGLLEGPWLSGKLLFRGWPGLIQSAKTVKELRRYACLLVQAAHPRAFSGFWHSNKYGMGGKKFPTSMTPEMRRNFELFKDGKRLKPKLPLVMMKPGGKPARKTKVNPPNPAVAEGGEESQTEKSMPQVDEGSSSGSIPRAELSEERELGTENSDQNAEYEDSVVASKRKESDLSGRSASRKSRKTESEDENQEEEDDEEEDDNDTTGGQGRSLPRKRTKVEETKSSRPSRKAAEKAKVLTRRLQVDNNLSVRNACYDSELKLYLVLVLFHSVQAVIPLMARMRRRRRKSKKLRSRWLLKVEAVR